MNPRLHCTPVFWVKEDLEKLRRFQSLMETTVSQVYQERAKNIEDLVAKGIASVEPEVVEMLTKENPANADVNDLPKKLRYSIIIHLFTTIETQGAVLCDEIAHFAEPPVKIKLSDLKGAKLERVRKYLDRVGGVFAANSPEWERIDWIDKLRHLIVHQGGEVPSGTEGRFLRDLASRSVGLTIDNAQQLFVSRELCESLIEAVETLFATAYAAAGLAYEPWKDDSAR